MGRHRAAAAAVVMALILVSALSSSVVVAAGYTFSLTSVSPNPVNLGSSVILSGTLCPSPSTGITTFVYYTRPDGSTVTRTPSHNPQDFCSSPFTVDYYAPDQAGTWSVYAQAYYSGALLATSGPIHFTVQSTGFSIVITQQSVGIYQGSSGTVSVSVSSSTTQSYTVSLSASGLPSGLTASFSPNGQNPPFSSTLTLSASTSAPTGTSTVTVSGSGGGYSASNTFSLTIYPQQQQPFDFSISVSPSSATVTAGATLNPAGTVSIGVVQGTAAPVTLSLSNLPSYVGTTDLNGKSCTPQCSVPFEITTLSSAPGGAYYLTITGTAADGATHQAAFTLNVSPEPVLYVTVTASSQNVVGGSAVTLAASISASNAGAPSGTTYSWSDSGGQLSSTTANPVTWTAPSVSSQTSYSVSVDVSASGYVSASGSVQITVNPGTASYAFILTSVAPNPVALSSPVTISGTLCPSPSVGITTDVFFTRPDRTIVEEVPSHNPQDFCSGFTVDYFTPDQTGTWSVSAVAYQSSTVLASSNTVQFSVTSQGFSISISQQSVGIYQGSSGVVRISVSSASAQSYSVSLSATGMPAGVSASFSPSSGTPPFGSNLTLSVSAAAVTGTYTVTVTGTGSGNTESNTFTLSIYSSPSSQALSVSLSADPSDVQSGGTTSTITATVIDQNGNPMSGIVLTFGATQGLLSQSSVTTDASGRAGVTLTLEQPTTVLIVVTVTAKTSSGYKGDTTVTFEGASQQDAATIALFSPPTGTVEPGDTINAQVTVKDAGTTTRAFWVGLSYQKPDGTFYDAEPQQTNVLSPGQQQTLTISLALPSDAPTGLYGAVAKIWSGYNSLANIMVTPLYYTSTAEDAFSVETGAAIITFLNLGSQQISSNPSDYLSVPGSQVAITTGVRNTGQVPLGLRVVLTITDPTGKAVYSTGSDIAVSAGSASSTVEFQWTIPSSPDAPFYIAVVTLLDQSRPSVIYDQTAGNNALTIRVPYSNGPATFLLMDPRDQPSPDALNPAVSMMLGIAIHGALELVSGVAAVVAGYIFAFLLPLEDLAPNVGNPAHFSANVLYDSVLTSEAQVKTGDQVYFVFNAYLGDNFIRSLSVSIEQGSTSGPVVWSESIPLYCTSQTCYPGPYSMVLNRHIIFNDTGTYYMTVGSANVKVDVSSSSAGQPTSSSVGAVVSLTAPPQQNGAPSGPSSIVSTVQGISVVVNSELNAISVQVASGSSTGRVITINLDSTLLQSQGWKNPSDIVVLLDGSRVAIAQDLADVLTVGSQPRYLILVGSGGMQVLVSIPHFSEHTVEVTSLGVLNIRLITSLIIYSLVTIIAVLLAIGLVFVWRKRKPAQARRSHHT